MRAGLIGFGIAVALGIAAVVIVHRTAERPGGLLLELSVGSTPGEFSDALYQTVGQRLQPGHRVALFNNGAVFDELVAGIARAEKSVHIEIYIWTKGAVSNRIIAALRARAPSVQCRILLDDFGSAEDRDEIASSLRAARCEVFLFRPGKRLERNHRKLAIIDGRVGFTGGFGIDDRWSGDAADEKHWRDTAVRIEGPAVTDMQLTFAQDWQEAGGPLLHASEFPPARAAGPAQAAFVASSASPVVTRAERLTQLAIDAAHRRLLIANAYFVPGKQVIELLGRHAAQKVDVRLLVPGKKSDSKFSFSWQQREYGELQKHGARIWEFQPTMLHAKTMVIDKSLSIIGSVNLDPLSLDTLEEGALVIEDEALATELASDFEKDCARAEEQK